MRDDYIGVLMGMETLLFPAGQTINFDNAIFLNNDKFKVNSLIRAYGGTLSGSALFDNNKSSISGGVITNPTSFLNINGDFVFTRNNSGQDGGVILNDAELSVSGATFGEVNEDGNVLAQFGNTAEDRGGAIMHRSGSSTAAIEGSKFYGNSAQEGGAIYNNGEMTITGTESAPVVFKGNTATAGGAVYNA